jgi:hypothetical protein
VRPDSDWDVQLVARDGAVADCARRFATTRGGPVEVFVCTLAELEETGAVGSPSEWDRYSYARAEVVIDKAAGEIRRIVEAKAVLAPEEARELADRALDTYVNSFYRSAKSATRGLPLEARLDAVESLSPLLTALFALHGRVRPFNGQLGWELETEPLGDERWAAGRLLPRLASIAATADPAEQQALFRDVEELARERGHDAVVDAWEPDVAFLRGG